MKIEKLNFDLIGKMAKSELPALLYRSYIESLKGSAAFQTFGDYVQRCYEKVNEQPEPKSN